jgi:outer membrane protein TolC
MIINLLATSKSGLSNLPSVLFAGFLPILLSTLVSAPSAKAQNTTINGSVPSGPPSDQVVRLTLREAISMALKYNLGTIESGENVQIARGQRVLALSNLLPQVSASASENIQQVNLATFGV